MAKRGIEMAIVLASALLLSGCLGVGHAVKTGYYARKGAEGFVRELVLAKNPPLLPGTYQTLAVLPVHHDLKELALTGSFKSQAEIGQKEVAEYLKEAWSLKIEQPKALNSLASKDKTLAVDIELLDYNQGGEHLGAGVGEWHVMIARVLLIDAASGKTVAEANIEGRVRVKGLPIHGVAEGVDKWLQKYATPELREEVRDRHDKAKER